MHGSRLHRVCGECSGGNVRGGERMVVDYTMCVVNAVGVTLEVESAW